MNYNITYDLHGKNLAVVIGHPGHELRIHRFIEIYQPYVYVLTDGSGLSGNSRINKTKDILDRSGAKLSSVCGYFTDKELYNIILANDVQPLIKLLDQLVEDFKKHDIQIILGDAYEGYNPTHDLCRYLINFVVKIFKRKWNIDLSNFDFLLDGHLDGNNQNESVCINLDENDFERKYQSAQQYSELSGDINNAINRYGKEVFKTECIAHVNNVELIKCSDIPFYEKYGLQKINDGSYNEVITYSKHLFPLVNKLDEYVSHCLKAI